MPTHSPLIDLGQLANASVLELGSGTGILAALLGPLAASWTATDYEPLLPLISKNVKRNIGRHLNARVDVRELDWTWSRKQLERDASDGNLVPDMILAVDCLFNESLVQPFVDTLDALACKVVIVVSELRSPDVLQLFLEQWLSLNTWHIWRAGNGKSEEGILGDSRVVWVGWK